MPPAAGSIAPTATARCGSAWPGTARSMMNDREPVIQVSRRAVVRRYSSVRLTGRPPQGTRMRRLRRTSALPLFLGLLGACTSSKPLGSDSRPTANIVLPAAGLTYRAGDTIQFSGTGNDAEDGAL